jgi:hypothetical protein
MQFQDTAITFDELAKIHGIEFPPAVSPDFPRPDIFLIDCEGLACLDEKTLALCNAMITLAQISKVNVLVLTEIPNESTIDGIRSLFSVNKFFNGAIAAIQSVSIVLVREVDINFNEKDFNEKINNVKNKISASQNQC